MDKQQVEKLEQRLAEKYRRDMDAIKRVKQLLAEEEIAGESPNDDVSVEAAVHQDEEMPEQAKSLISQVQILFETHPAKSFTIAFLEKLLKENGWEFKATNPSSSLHTAIRDLRERKIVKVSRQGVGSQPNFYMFAGHGGGNLERRELRTEEVLNGTSPKSTQGVLSD